MDKTDTSKDEHIRTEFARAFGWYKSQGNFSVYGESTPRLPTWEEIFIETGRLLNRSQILSDTQHIKSLETQFQSLEEVVRKLTEK